MARFYGATLSVIRDKANRARGKPSVLLNLLRQCKNAVGNDSTNREEARRTYLHIQRLYNRCQSVPSQETAHIQPSVPSG